MTNLKNDDREILVDCDFASDVRVILSWLSTQLSDGYWEGKEIHGEYWNCFHFGNEFELGKRAKLKIIVISDPIYDRYKQKTKKFMNMSDVEVCNYVKETLFEMIDDYDYVFANSFSDREVEVLRSCITDWKVLPTPLPKVTHKELVELLGHDFEYIDE